MEIYYLVIVFVLFILAVSDLIFGVANDAVNFLNSAIGSKVAPRHIILVFASLGVLGGALFSSGMMEVARKGLFNPEMFNFAQVMGLFVAVMFTDVLLLDLYNTFGLPTSTTVSLVFGLLGAALGTATYSVLASSGGLETVMSYINTERAFIIISGIFLSVIISFNASLIVQYIVRMIFTFDYKPRIQKYGAIFGAVAFTLITFFLFTKGIKGSIFENTEFAKWITKHMSESLLYSFAILLFVFFILNNIIKINIFKPIVIAGTFALAFSFAANDLVNFIGVPLAGYQAFQSVSFATDPSSTMMTALNDQGAVPFLILVISGAIMIVTIWKSKKSNTVTKTEVNLSRQGKGKEKFKKSAVAKNVVKSSLFILDMFKTLSPKIVTNWVNSRFDKSKYVPVPGPDGKMPAFDLIRASVNLVVASSLISFGTSLKLPLSTTFVTFIVAMGTSLADRAWEHDNAVNRVNGVLTVVGGWFLTAVFALMLSFVFGLLISAGGLTFIMLLLFFSAFLIYRTHKYHGEQEKKEDESEKAAS
ncbi:MAG: inorganic phosphate transporter [Bacteroidetes bacterium]|nr:inorganic phosphate transporter [Bacteroidota bacterium]